MPKILIVGSVAGSLVNFRGDLIKQWRQRGFAVTALTRPAEAMRQANIRALGAKYRPIPLYRDGMTPLQDLKLLFSLRRIIREEQPAYIFAYTVKPIIYAAFSARLTGKTRLFAMITGLGFAFSGGSLKQRLVKSVLRLMYRGALKRCELVFFQNRDDLALFRKLKIIKPDQKVELVNGSGVNLDHYYYSKPAPAKELTFLLIARLLTSKGIREYAEAAQIIRAKYPKASNALEDPKALEDLNDRKDSQGFEVFKDLKKPGHPACSQDPNYPGVRFVLVGRLLDAPGSIDREELDRWQEEGLLEYAGGTYDVRPYLEACSVYVLPSYREGTPRSVLEAMAMGRPVITTDAPGCRETVTEGRNGFLVPVRDSEALADAMEKFMREPALIEKMGAQSRKYAEEKFDVKKVNQVILAAMGLNGEDAPV